MKKNIIKILSYMMIAVLLVSVDGMVAVAAESEQSGYVEISMEDAMTRTSGNYSRGLTTLNIVTSGVSNQCRVTSGSVPAGAVVTKVEVYGTKSKGSGTIYVYVEHEDSGHTASKLFQSSPVSFTTEFDGYDADSAWIVWIEGSNWSTLKNGSIKVYFTT